MAIDIEIGAGSISTGGSAPTRSLDERVIIGTGAISTGGSAPTRSMNEQREILTKALMLSGHAPMIFVQGPILGYLPGLGECLFGLSSHEKPVANTLRTGLLFFEVDTGNTWVWVGYEWIAGPGFPATV